jgi:beta-N-acetylhexosaminidase
MNRKLAIFIFCICAFTVSGCSLFSEEITKNPETASDGVDISTDASIQEEDEEKTLEERAKVNRKEVTDTATILGTVQEIMSEMTLKEKVGQMFIVNLEQLDDSQGSYYEFRECTKEMEKTLKKTPPGGVILFSRNIEKRNQVLKLNAALQDACKYPLFVSVDEEGGDVARIANNSNMQTTSFPSMQQVGESGDTVYAQEIGETIGKDISQLGFNVDFAPVADINTSELNQEIGNRSFGSDTKLVSNMVQSFVKGLQSTNVSATLKHFPGQGSSTGNTHNEAVNLDKNIDNLRKTDFKPFQAGIKAGADFIMVSHVSISRVTENTLPASMSDIVMQSILRTEFSFDGIIITDAMDMTAITSEYTASEAAVASISAGADIVLMPQNYEEALNGVLAAIEDGTITESRINESVQRILEVKVKRGLLS